MAGIISYGKRCLKKIPCPGHPKAGYKGRGRDLVGVDSDLVMMHEDGSSWDTILVRKTRVIGIPAVGKAVARSLSGPFFKLLFRAINSLKK